MLISNTTSGQYENTVRRGKRGSLKLNDTLLIQIFVYNWERGRPRPQMSAKREQVPEPILPTRPLRTSPRATGFLASGHHPRLARPFNAGEGTRALQLERRIATAAVESHTDPLPLFWC